MSKSMASVWTIGVASAIAGVLLIEDMASPQLYTLMLYLPGLDKVLHFGQSFVICYVLNVLLQRAGIASRKAMVLALIGAVAAAGLDELQQSWRSDRNVEAADTGAGVAGIVAAVALSLQAARPRVAVVLAAIALLVGGSFTYGSYLKLRDYNRGVRAERSGRSAEALQHYLAAVKSDPKNPEVYNAAAWLMTQSGQGDPRQAVALAERSLTLRPGDPDTLDTYGWALVRAGRAADALSPLETALAAKPNIYCVHYHLAMAYLKLGRIDSGIRHLRNQIELMPMTREAELASEVLASLNQS